jgi:hypothetical protein
MAPSATIDNPPLAPPNLANILPEDWNQQRPQRFGPDVRTLLLSPPSLSAHPKKIAEAVEAHDGTPTDLHMLDRIISGAVQLPENTYDEVVLLVNTEGDAGEGAAMLENSREGFAAVANSMRPGAFMRSPDAKFGTQTEMVEGLMAGLNPEIGGMAKPWIDPNEVVLLPQKKEKKYMNSKMAGSNRKILLDEDGLMDEDSLMEGIEQSYKPDYSGESFLHQFLAITS